MSAAQMPQVQFLLRRLGCRIDSKAPALFSSFSQTMRCLRNGERVLVKINRADPQLPRIESTVLQALSGSSSNYAVPLLQATTPHALALEWIDGAMMFTRRRQHRESADVDFKVGAALASIHAPAESVKELVKNRPAASALVDAVTWMSVEIWAALSTPGRQVFSALQSDRHSMHALTQLKKNEGAHFVHGDFRQANILVRRRSPRIVVLDWERAHLGSPASDVGMYLAEEFALFLTPEIDREFKVALLRKRCRAFVEGYLDVARMHGQSDVKSFLDECTQWTGVGLLNRVLTLVDDSHRASAAATHLFKHATWCLSSPRDAAKFLLGAIDGH